MAMELLGERWSLAEAARRVGVAARTLRSWRASPEGHLLLEAAREKHRAAFAGALEKARRTLIESLPEASEVIREGLQSSKFEARFRSACAAFDRAGLHPRSEFDPPEEVDMTSLTEDELRQYLELSRKILIRR